MKGLATVQMLKAIEKGTGKRIHELFDLICGTSTGGMLAVALGIKLMTLDQCEEIYKSLGAYTVAEDVFCDVLFVTPLFTFWLINLILKGNLSLLNLCQRTMKLQLGEKSWTSSTKVHRRVLELWFMDLKYGRTFP